MGLSEQVTHGLQYLPGGVWFGLVAISILNLCSITAPTGVSYGTLFLIRLCPEGMHSDFDIQVDGLDMGFLHVSNTWTASLIEQLALNGASYSNSSVRKTRYGYEIWHALTHDVILLADELNSY